MTTICVFPGHGSQRVGMGAGVLGRFPELTAQADAVLGYSVEELCLRGPAARLADNRFAQPATYVVSALEFLARTHRGEAPPDVVAGHSAGEYAALFAAGSVDFGTGLRIVARRAELMNRRPTGAMVSVLGLAPERISELLAREGLTEVSVACFNSPEQTALSGPEGGIRAAAELLRGEAEAVFWVSLTTAPHSPRLARAARELAGFLESAQLAAPSIPVIANVTARPYGPADLPGLLIRQLTEPVRWTQTARYLLALDRPRFTEIGPGTVLTGLIEATRAAAPSGRAAAAEAAGPDLAATAAALVREALASGAARLGGPVLAQTPLTDLGLTSAEMIATIVELEKSVGELPVTLFVEHRDIEEIAGYLAAEHGDALAAASPAPASPAPASPAPASPAPARPAARHEAAAERPAPAPGTAQEPGGAALPENAIAIVGMAGRFPGAADVNALWDLVAHGRSAVRELAGERWEHSRYLSAGPDGGSGTTYSRWAALLADADRFDSFFFGISPGEAEQMDAQQRVFLETAYEALQDGGLTRDSLGRDTGVYVGAMNSDYAVLTAQGALSGACPYPYAGNYQIANRVSYFLDLRGPSITIDTACSSSLVAVHLACEALLAGSVTAAIAGGVNILAHPARHVQYANMGMLSRAGRCATFSARADGIVLGEGVAAVVLKRLDRAVADGDVIHGVIRGSWTSSEGHTSGFTVPSPQAQASVVRRALERAGIPADTIGYVEAHGTGTPLGDPIEVRGLALALGPLAGGTRAIASLKPNIGHLEAAAGAAGLVKVLLQFRHRALAPSLHADPLNPRIKFAGGSFEVPRRLSEWSRLAPGIPRRAGVSSFGLGGVNAHLVVEEFDPAPAAARQPVRDPLLFLLSGRTPGAVRQYAARLASRLAAQPEDLRDVAETLRTGREHLGERAAFTARSHEELLSALLALAGEAPAGTAAVRAPATDDQAAGPPHGDEPLPEPARRWCAGAELPDCQPPAGQRGRRIPLPTYPFADERHWVSVADALRAGSARNGRADSGTGTAGRAVPGPDGQAGLLEGRLRGAVAEVVKAPPGQLEDDVSFTEYGLNSVLLARLSGELSRAFAVTLTMTELAEHQTIAGLASYLMREHRAAVAAAIQETEDESCEQ